jgi:hypothetical protein
MRPFPINTSGEFLLPFSLCAQDDYVWKTNFRAKNSRAEVLQTMHASYMHLLNSVDLEVHQDRKLVVEKTANPRYLTECLIEEARSYEKTLADAVAHAPAGLQPPETTQLDLDVIEEWSKEKYSSIFKEVSARAASPDPQPIAKFQGVLDARPEKLLQTTIEHCVQHMFANVEDTPIVVSRDDVTSFLDASLKGMGVQLAASERPPPWMKDNKKWEATQWDSSSGSSWEPRKKAKGGKGSSWAAKSVDSWSTYVDPATPVFGGASGPGEPPMRWPPAPPPPPAEHPGVFQAA